MGANWPPGQARRAARCWSSGKRRNAPRESEKDEVVGILGKVAGQAQRAGEVIRRLRALASREQTARQLVESNEVIEEILELAALDVRAHGCLLEVDLAASLPEILVDRIQVQQVILNLVRNAIEAMEGADRTTAVIRVCSSLDDKSRVEVSVVDQGAGLAKEDEDTVFDPFFSTKPSGLGIGLSICRSIVEAHGGDIGFRHNPDRGMTFFFNLPAAEESSVGAS